ncbi:MAG: hypothetical protein ACI8TQ_000586 [Planctomycetota bacterium]|jgi:hypothetical protein
MTDTSSRGNFLHPAWHSLTTRIAVAAGTLAAIVSLTQHTPVWVASLRGAVAFFVVRTIAGWGLTALGVALKADTIDQSSEESEPS